MIPKVIALALLMVMSIHASSGEVDSNTTFATDSQASSADKGIVDKVLNSLDGIGKDLGDFMEINHLFSPSPDKE